MCGRGHGYGIRIRQIESLHVAIRFAVSVSVCRIRVRVRTHRITPMRLHYNHFLPDSACRIRMPHPYLWNPSFIPRIFLSAMPSRERKRHDGKRKQLEK